MNKMLEFRQSLEKALDELMAKDEKIVILDADLAKPNGTFPLYKKYPNRCFDVGIAEANMVGIAAGLASCGYKPIVVTFTPFATRRVCDQIAISVAYAKNNVKIIGTDPGVCAESNGGTHMSMEDIGVLRSIPEMIIFDPADSVQLEKALPQIMDYDKCVYIRIPRKLKLEVFDENYKFKMFTSDVVKTGKDVAIVASGIMVKEALEASCELEKLGIDCEVISANFIKPLDEKTILASIKKTNCVVTCDNHNIIGGLYSAVCELVCKEYPIKVYPIGVNDEFGQVGSLNELKEYYKLRSSDIVELVKKIKK